MTAGASAGAITAPASGPLRHGLIAGLGVSQIVSWGTLVYSFPLLAEPTMREFGLAKAMSTCWRRWRWSSRHSRRIRSAC
jgi:hypothetical protein